jgi:Leucine-rich repeat (LRR) protein
MINLKVVELRNNSIREITGISPIPILETLDLSGNGISHFNFSSQELKRLEKIILQSNLIDRISLIYSPGQSNSQAISVAEYEPTWISMFIDYEVYKEWVARLIVF